MMKKLTRATSFKITIIFIFVVLIARLFYIQLINGDYYQNLAEEKGEKEIIDPAPRGEIIDRNGKKIATSKQGYNIIFSNYSKKSSEKKEDYNKRINTALIKTIKIITTNGMQDKINTSSLPIGIEGDKYVYNFTATSDSLRAKLEKNFKKAHGIDEKEEKLKTTFNIDQVVTELQKKYYLIDESTGKNIYNLTKNETLQTIALRAAISDVAYSQYKPVYIAKNVTQETAFAIISKSSELPGVGYEISPIRDYPNGSIGSAFIGYLGKISEEDYQQYTNLGYDVSRELIGKSGLEKSLENNKELGINLRGEPGIRYVNVDNMGQITKETAKLDPIPGDTVKTTIDMDLQKVAEESLVKNLNKSRTSKYAATRGAAIVTDIKTGEILALASVPTYDPNVFAETGAISNDIYKQYFAPQGSENDTADTVAKPMFNYATKGKVPPGSIFKPIMAIAGLEEGAINESTVVVCTGKYHKEGIDTSGDRFRCSKRSGHGPVNIITALKGSCNPYFYETGYNLGFDKVTEWSAKFGLAPNPETGEIPSTGIEIEESLGEVGSVESYKRNNIKIYRNDIIEKLKETEYGSYSTIQEGTEEYRLIEEMLKSGKYDKSKLETVGIVNKKAQKYIEVKVKQFSSAASRIGELLNISIGQGATILTPMQMISALNTILNDGKKYATHLVKEVLNPDGSLKREIKPELLSEISFSKKTKDLVLQGMSEVTHDGGTAATTFRNFPIKTGGKTGSTTISKWLENKGRGNYGSFLGFAPFDNPEISVLVVMYDVAGGGAAAPVAKDIYEQYFGLNKGKTSSEE